MTGPAAALQTRLHISAWRIKGTRSFSALYLQRLPMATLDLIVLRHRPGFVQQADLCIATPAL